MLKLGPETTKYDAVVRAGAPTAFDFEINEWGYKDDRPERRRKRLTLLWFVVLLVIFGLLLFLLVRIGGNNSHPVIEGAWYRAAQMDATDLGRAIDEHQIRTVLRLVGDEDSNKADYESDSRVCEKRGVNLLMAKMAASRLPWRSELSTLFAHLDLIAKDKKMLPVLVHCSQGSDRTGLVSAIWLHDYQDKSLDEARGQLSFLPYMHVPFGEAHSMDDFLNLYEHFEHEHKGAKIRDWVREHYFEEKSGREIGKWYDGKLYTPH